MLQHPKPSDPVKEPVKDQNKYVSHTECQTVVNDLEKNA
jgi:hypothetical protein